jgi:hypothetical protein
VATWTLGTYLLAGVLIAAALTQRSPSTSTSLERAGTFVVHATLWPIFAPLLLPSTPARPATPGDLVGYSERIDAAERSLAEALQLLGRDLNDPLSIEAARVRNLGQAMRSAAQRVSELDGLQKAQGAQEADLAAQVDKLRQEPESGPIAEIVEQRLGHLRRLKALRTQAGADLERALARAGELATRLTLLRYEDPQRTGGAATQARELTDSIEELCRALNEVRAA